MKTIKCLVLDDEPLAIELLKDYISKISFLELVEATTDAVYAIDKIQNEAIDLVFLDIQMPEIDGIQFMKITQNKCKVILTTAYEKYALEGYKHNVIDYLLKPISFTIFYESALKAKQHFNDFQNSTIETTVENNQKNFFFVKTDGKNIMVLHADIHYVEGLKDYILIHLQNQKLVVLENLKDIELKLPNNDFKRVHRSFIIRTDKIIAVEGNQILLKQKAIPIGETYKKDFFSWIESNK
jgi:two-component system, LytTR family, response regulator